MTHRATCKILYGPPGTGKTYRAAREAVFLIDGKVDESSMSTRYEELVVQGQIWWVTFHASYAYEDFVEGFRPIRGEEGLNYEVVDGPFKRACSACRSSLTVGEQIGRYEVIGVDSGGVALRSSVNRADGVTSVIDQYADYWTIERLRERGLGPDSLSVPGKDNERKQEFARRSGLPTTILANAGPYRALYEHLESRAASDRYRPVVLVLDEINRADLARVLGEAMTLLEHDKREGALEERAVLLPYSQRTLRVPPTLSVIGTMNTADRSIALMDFALRRRFTFEEVLPEPGLLPTDYAGVNLGECLTRWNHRITALATREYCLGHSDLMAHSLEAVRGDQGLADNQDGKLRALALVMRTKTVPLLLEYFHEDWRRAEAVLGNQGLLVDVPLDDVAELAAEVADLSDATSHAVAPWWNPTSGDWDLEKFRSALLESTAASSP